MEAKLSSIGEEIEKFRAEVERESLADEARIKSSLKEESERIVSAAEQEIAAAAAQATAWIAQLCRRSGRRPGRQAIGSDAGEPIAP